MNIRIILGAAALLFGVEAVQAMPDYDRKLEQAAIEAVSSRIGPVRENLRGTFSPGMKPEMSSAAEPTAIRAHPVRQGWRGGLAPAIDPGTTGSVARAVMDGPVRQVY